MTSYLTSIDTFSLSRTVFEKIRVKIFEGQTKWRILTFLRSRSLTDIFHFWKRVWLSPNGVDWHIARQNRCSRFGCTLIKERKKLKKKKKKKKDEPLYVGYVYLCPGKFFRNQILLGHLGRWRNQSCQIFFQSVHSGVSGKGSNFGIFSVNRGWPLQLLYYRTTVIPDFDDDRIFSGYRFWLHNMNIYNSVSHSCNLNEKTKSKWNLNLNLNLNEK